MSMKTTRTVTYGPGGTRTITEYSSGGGGIDDFGGLDDGFGNDIGGFGRRPIGGIRGGTAGDASGGGGRRFSSGWGTRRQDDPARPAPGLPPMKLAGKTFDEIKAQCQKEGRLFEDPDFPAIDDSVFYSRRPPRPFEWKRPTELVPDPHLFVGGASRFDIKQGELGDCWLLAAVACLSQFPDLLNRVIPPNQSFSKDEGYCGIFRFNFWVFGKWTEVVIDDRLPTHNGKLVFLHSEDGNEFWTPLLEKAYAKMNSSYESLKGGSTSEALEDFSGGVTEMFDLTQAPPNLYSIMEKAHERNSMMGCSVDQGGRGMEAELTNGLIVGHAYSVTGIKTIEVQTPRAKGKIQLVRARNPWGNEAEWKGAWGDSSPEWQLISQEQRDEMGLSFRSDGEFWMSFTDFVKNFTKLEICNLGPDTMSGEGSSKKRFEMTVHEGCWKKRVTAGGCRNYINTFWTNPQYRVTVVDADEGDDDDSGTLIVALMQKERRSKRKEGLDLLTMGYGVYPLKDPNCGPLDVNYFKYTASVAKSPQFINMREICGRHKLPPGSYCIVPSTFEPNEEGDFMLRVYSEKVVSSNELDEDTNFTADEKPDVRQKAPAVVPPKTAEDAQTEKQLREAFKKIAGEDLEVDAYELQNILNSAFMKEFKFNGFSDDTCRSLVAMKDVDRSGKLGYEEFKKLWNDMRIWKTAFKNHDTDGSGTFNSYELRETLHAIGVSVSNATFNSLVMRYSHRDGKIYFDDYIHCIARLCTMFDIFKDMSSGSKKAQFSLDEFIATTMYS